MFVACFVAQLSSLTAVQELAITKVRLLGAESGGGIAGTSHGFPGLSVLREGKGGGSGTSSPKEI